MSMKIITGSTGTTHVTSNNDGEFNEAIFGKELLILPNGNKLNARIVDNNTIEVADGDLIFQGRHALIEPNTTETITIDTGAVNKNRIDLIVAHYELDSASGYESLTLRVIKGAESTGTASVPSITEGDIRTGARVAEAVLYQVNIEGITLKSVTRKVDIIDAIIDSVNNVASALNALNSNLSNFDWSKTSIPSGTNINAIIQMLMDKTFPLDPRITDGLSIFDSRVTIVDGGYYIKNGICYFDMTVRSNGNFSPQYTTSLISGLPEFTSTIANGVFVTEYYNNQYWLACGSGKNMVTNNLYKFVGQYPTARPDTAN